jgi:hypothetical protein
MPVTTEKFDQVKIEKLKHFLEDMAGKGNPRPYEIFVDNLKVVPKTEEAKDFDNYEYYVNENTEKLRILIYNSPASPRNDQYCFLLQNNQLHKSVNGLGEIDSIIHAEQLQSQIEDQKKNKFKLGNINLGELASVAVEGMIRRNPQLLTKIPGGEALAGIIEQDNLEKETKQLPDEKETQASFQKVAPTAAVTEEQQRYIMFLQQLDVALTEEQMQATLQILNQFVQHPDKISIVADLLNK